ncbi:MAG: Cobalt/zinc/cadmium efflux transporter [Gemmatimonadetes bacterium]|nr:Cobalt/zinc/cadmium efflux transporter [Gemmatimonadota bacterium]
MSTETPSNLEHITPAGRKWMNRKFILSAIAIVIAVVVAWLVFHRSATAPAPAPVASALVKTAPLRQIDLSESLTAFGEVTTGQVVAISFPRAGQVSRILVIPGQRVERGTPLASLTSDPNARFAYTQAQSAVDFARGELRRISELFSLQLATQSQIDAARKSLTDAEANLEAQRQLGGGVGSATLTAPFAGVVTTVAVAQGDRIAPGAVIMELGPTNVLRVRLGIEPADSRLVRVGTPVTLSSLADSSKSVSTKIAESQGLVDPRTQLIDAVVTLPASSSSFFVPGMHVRAMINVGRHQSWAVPRAAVLTDANGAYVFQVAGGKAHRVNVTQGVESQGMVAISGPFDTHLPIVVLGNYELQEGMPVREGGAAG